MCVLHAGVGFLVKRNKNRLWLNLAGQEFTGSILVPDQFSANWAEPREAKREESLVPGFTAAGIAVAKCGAS